MKIVDWSELIIKQLQQIYDFFNEFIFVCIHIVFCVYCMIENSCIHIKIITDEYDQYCKFEFIKSSNLLIIVLKIIFLNNIYKLLQTLKKTKRVIFY